MGTHEQFNWLRCTKHQLLPQSRISHQISSSNCSVVQAMDCASTYSVPCQCLTSHQFYQEGHPAKKCSNDPQKSQLRGEQPHTGGHKDTTLKGDFLTGTHPATKQPQLPRSPECWREMQPWVETVPTPVDWAHQSSPGSQWLWWTSTVTSTPAVYQCVVTYQSFSLQRIIITIYIKSTCIALWGPKMQPHNISRRALLVRIIIHILRGKNSHK